MKRLVWGIILLSIGVLNFIANIEKLKTDPANGDISSGILISLILSTVGGVLSYFGWRYIKQKREAAAIALRMIRDDGKLDAALLAQRMSLPEVDVRPMIIEAQRKGILPFKIEIV